MRTRRERVDALGDRSNRMVGDDDRRLDPGERRVEPRHLCRRDRALVGVGERPVGSDGAVERDEIDAPDPHHGGERTRRVPLHKAFDRWRVVFVERLRDVVVAGDGDEGDIVIRQQCVDSRELRGGSVLREIAGRDDHIHVESVGVRERGPEACLGPVQHLPRARGRAGDVRVRDHGERGRAPGRSREPCEHRPPPASVVLHRGSRRTLSRTAV